MHNYPGVQIAWKRILSIAQNTPPDPASIVYKDDDGQEEDVLTTPTTVTRMRHMGRALQNIYTITSQDEGYMAFIVTVVQELNYDSPIAMTFVKHIIDYSEIPSKTTLSRITQATTNMLLAAQSKGNDKLEINASIVWSLLARKFAGNLAEVMWQEDAVVHILIDVILANSNSGPMVKLFALLALESFALTGGIKKRILNNGSCNIILNQNLQECQTYLSLLKNQQPLYYQLASPLSNITISPDLTLTSSTYNKKHIGKKFYHGLIQTSKLFLRRGKKKSSSSSSKESNKTSVFIDLVDDEQSESKACILTNVLPIEKQYGNTAWYGYIQLQHCVKWSLESTFVTDNCFLPPCEIMNHMSPSPSGRVCLSSKFSTKHLKPSEDWLEIRNDTYFLESARATACVNSGRWYYEVLLLTNGVVQIGWGTYKCHFSPQDGCGVGDDSNGFSFDTYQSAIWESSQVTYPQGQENAHGCQIGDVIGSLLDMDQGMCTFFINGQDVGLVVQFSIAKKRMLGLYPTLSLTSHQHVVVNFGDRPWLYHPPVVATFKAMSESDITLEKSQHEEDEWDGPLCTLCFSEPNQVTLVPCQHDGFGKSCAKILDLCPLCRTKISKRVTKDL